MCGPRYTVYAQNSSLSSKQPALTKLCWGRSSPTMWEMAKLGVVIVSRF